MRLQRYQDAIVAFEVAAKTRPENTKIIEALIACYQQLGMPATNWENKLRKIQEASSVENGN
jgi:lipopolysaccharide biosynthesis regulator YciM